MTITHVSQQEKLLDALTEYFIKENSEGRFNVPGYRIYEMCRILLAGDEHEKTMLCTSQVREKTAFETYYNENLKIMDYLHLVTYETRKQLGQYATPIEIVRHILRSVGYNPTKTILEKKVIDPACGSGAFLVEAARIYLKALHSAGIPFSEQYPMLLSAIAGVDIDPRACFFARLNLATLLARPILAFVTKHSITELQPLPVHCADTLDALTSEMQTGAFLYDKPSLRLFARFDYVVGNPPYFKIKNLNQKIKESFSESIYGHPNAYALFLQAGISMLKTGGRMGYIVPRSMLSGLYFKNLRSFIEKEARIREIVYISDRKKVFDNVLHGTMILSLERDASCGDRIAVSLADSLKDMGSALLPIEVDRNKVIQRLNGTSVWFVADSMRMYRIIDRIIKEHPLLTSSDINCQAKTGQIVWNRVKTLLTAQPRRDTLPLVWATDVSKFSFTFNRMAEARPCYLQVNEKTEGLIVKGPAIIVQRVTADEQPYRIVACLPEQFLKKQRDGYFVENHLNVIQPVEGKDRTDLYFLLGVLNSDIVDFFIRAMNGNTQVSATELNLLPIPAGRYETKISKTAAVVQNTLDVKKRQKLLGALNDTIAAAYGLNDTEHEFIRKFLRSRRGRDN